MKAILESLDVTNKEKLLKHFNNEFMKKVFLFRYECYDWEEFCKDYNITKFNFEVNENLVYIELEKDNVESDLKKLIQYIEEFIDENMSPQDSFFGYKVFKLKYDNYEKLIC